MAISMQTYEQLALEDDDALWELECGQLRQKPPMTWEHSRAASRLVVRLVKQLDESVYQVSMNAGRLRVADGAYFIPDVIVVPQELMVRTLQRRPRGLELYDEPLPLVVEVWSPSTGDYDVKTKLQGYQQRGDAEIWLVHPYERTLTAWRRQPDGSYSETLHRDGLVEPMALPDVRIELITLFE